MPEYTTLATPTGKAGDAGLTDLLRSNMCMFLDWALLSQGYFMNVGLTTLYPYGGSPSKLRLADDWRFPAGTAWDGFKNNWCWETNVEFSSQPTEISGVYINGIFTPFTTSQYANTYFSPQYIPPGYFMQDYFSTFINIGNSTVGVFINYPAGRVIFTSALPTDSVIEVEYSYKYYNVYPSTVEWFRQLTEGTWRVDDPQFQSAGSGLWTTFPDSRGQLPAVAVEISPGAKAVPYGLGGGQWIIKDVLFHVFAETAFDRDNFVDILSYQKWKKAFVVDKNAISRAGAFPLSPYGYLINPSSTYPLLVSNYTFTDYYIDDVSVQRTDNNPQSVYYGVVRWSCKVNAPWAV